MFLYLFRLGLTKYYVTENEKDYICSLPGDGGISKCHLPDHPEHHLPHFVYRERSCNGSALPFANNTPSAANDSDSSTSSSSCVNWNQYYSDCKAGVNNPFQGAISFDNIGLAWVAIFQVCRNATHETQKG